MRVLMFHGYLLGGTGSNVYNANLAQALARLGHEVHLLCQERAPLDLPWVDAAGDWDAGALRVTAPRREPAAITVYRPPIGRVLPVYVADAYAGFDARPFDALSIEELDAYVEANVRAVRDIVARVRPDCALANHLVMGPLVLARAGGVPYAVKIHGSALEYTVKPRPERFAPLAAEGLLGAGGVLVGSRHTAESLWAEMGPSVPGLPDRTRLGPPGVDIERFAPRAPGAARAGLDRLIAHLGSLPADPADSPSSFARDPSEAAHALATISDGDRVVLYVGKLIASKGVELLLAAWPSVAERVPGARLVIVGFGAFRPALERLRDALAGGDLDTVRDLAARGRELEGGPAGELPELARWAAGSGGAPGSGMDRVHFAGRLEHGELEDVMPLAEALVMPSTFPEAFGMVAAEAAACGTLPLVARHSGMAEVARSLEGAVPPDAAPWLSFGLGEPEPAVDQIADRLVAWLSAEADLREVVRRELVRVARERYSWEGVARTMVAAACGELDDLPRVDAGP